MSAYTQTHTHTHAHMYTHTRAHTHMHAYTHTHTHVHTHTCTHTCTHIHTCTHTHTHTHTRTRTRMYTQTHVHTHTHTNTHQHKHTHTHKHTCTHTDTCARTCTHTHTNTCTRTHTHTCGSPLVMYSTAVCVHICHCETLDLPPIDWQINGYLITRLSFITMPYTYVINNKYVITIEKCTYVHIFASTLAPQMHTGTHHARRQTLSKLTSRAARVVFTASSNFPSRLNVLESPTNPTSRWIRGHMWMARR